MPGCRGRMTSSGMGALPTMMDVSVGSQDQLRWDELISVIGLRRGGGGGYEIRGYQRRPHPDVVGRRGGGAAAVRPKRPCNHGGFPGFTRAASLVSDRNRETGFHPLGPRNDAFTMLAPKADLGRKKKTLRTCALSKDLNPVNRYRKPQSPVSRYPSTPHSPTYKPPRERNGSQTPKPHSLLPTRPAGAERLQSRQSKHRPKRQATLPPAARSESSGSRALHAASTLTPLGTPGPSVRCAIAKKKSLEASCTCVVKRVPGG